MREILWEIPLYLLFLIALYYWVTKDYCACYENMRNEYEKSFAEGWISLWYKYRKLSTPMFFEKMINRISSYHGFISYLCHSIYIKRKNESQPRTCLPFCGIKGVKFSAHSIWFIILITSLSHPIRQRSTTVSTDDKKDLSPLHTTGEIYR